MKTPKVSPIFKNGKKPIVSSYRPISLLPFFLEILKRITRNRLYSYLTENSYQTSNTFNYKNYSFDIFIEL